jgi:hypothetical protein
MGRRSRFSFLLFGGFQGGDSTTSFRQVIFSTFFVAALALPYACITAKNCFGDLHILTIYPAITCVANVRFLFMHIMQFYARLTRGSKLGIRFARNTGSRQANPASDATTVPMISYQCMPAYLTALSPRSEPAAPSKSGPTIW